MSCLAVQTVIVRATLLLVAVLVLIGIGAWIDTIWHPGDDPALPFWQASAASLAALILLGIGAVILVSIWVAPLRTLCG